jgi:hypothetical protein
MNGHPVAIASADDRTEGPISRRALDLPKRGIENHNPLLANRLYPIRDHPFKGWHPESW